MINEFKLELAKDFPVLYKINSSEKNEVIQGFGGIEKGYPLKHRPILFIHGNGGDMHRFPEIAKLFLNEGYSMQELWAFSYMGTPPTPNNPIDPHAKALADIDQVIQAVMKYTGSRKIDIIAHSLGVTLTLYWMRQKNSYHCINRFVMIAGAPNGFPNMQEGSEWRKEWMDKNLRYQGVPTPYSAKSPVRADKGRSISYIIVHSGKDDNMINSYGENSSSSVLEGADAVYNLEGKLKMSENPSEIEKTGGLHVSIIMNPGLVFEVIKKHFNFHPSN